MRWLFLVSALNLFFIGAAAAQQQSLTDTGRGFGTAYCRKEFKCPNASGERPGLDYYRALIAEGNSCVGRFLAVSSSSGLFEETFPDSEGCLVSKPPASVSAETTTVVPKCCIKASDKKPNMCALVCTLREMR